MAFWNPGQIKSINEGARPNDGTGDNIRDAFLIVDSNFGNISSQLGQVNQSWTNANVEFNFDATFGNINNLTSANIVGTSSNLTGNSYAKNVIANTALYSSTVTYLTGNTYVSGNIIPTGVGTYNLGTPTMPFGNLYVQNTVSTNQISQSTDAGILKIHANSSVGDTQDTGIFGNVSSSYTNGGNVYAFFGYQYTTDNFIYKITPVDTTSGNNIVVGGVYGNVQFGSGLFSNTTQSTSTTTGALIVAGGGGFGANLTVGGSINSTGNMYVAGSQVLTTSSDGIGNLYNGTSALITGNVVFPAATASTSYLTGAVVLPYGGMGVFGNVTSPSGFVGPLYGTLQTAAQPNITSVGTLTGLSLINGSTLNASSISATSIGVGTLTITTGITATGITLSGLLSVSASSATITGNTTSGNISTAGNVSASYYLGSGSNLTGIPTLAQVQVLNANLGTTTTSLQTLNANVGSYQINTNANIGTQFNNFNTLNANVGSYQITTNANLGTATTSLQTLNANVGSYQITTNANLGTATNNITTLLSNAGAQATSLNSINANLGTATNNITTLLSNAATQQTQITSLYTNANANTVAYFNVNSITTTGITVPSITHSGTSGVGNIGGVGAVFNTVFATATTALYADLAERYTADSDYAPGTVVVFGGSAEVTTTHQFADVSVAGAISTEPAYLMNSESDGLPVALRGRIPVKIIGPVAKGDLLVTAGNRPGFAISVGKSTEYPLAVFAKSLVTDSSEGEKIIEAVII